jgi:hypothetical protein
VRWMKVEPTDFGMLRCELRQPPSVCGPGPRKLRTHLTNASAESGSRQGEAFRESFQRDAHTARPDAENSATRQITFRFSSADGIASNEVILDLIADEVLSS